MSAQQPFPHAYQNPWILQNPQQNQQPLPQQSYQAQPLTYFQPAQFTHLPVPNQYYLKTNQVSSFVHISGEAKTLRETFLHPVKMSGFFQR